MGFSADVARLFTEMTRGFNEGHVKPMTGRSKENTTPTSIEEFAVSFAAAYNTKFPTATSVGSTR